MKTTLRNLLYLALLTTAACSRSPREKAITTIVHHLEKTLKDPASYIPVEYDVVEMDPSRHDSTASAPSLMQAYSFAGWKITHKFKSRSESGMVKDTQLTFYVNRQYRIENVQ